MCACMRGWIDAIYAPEEKGPCYRDHCKLGGPNGSLRVSGLEHRRSALEDASERLLYPKPHVVPFVICS